MRTIHVFLSALVASTALTASADVPAYFACGVHHTIEYGDRYVVEVHASPAIPNPDDKQQVTGAWVDRFKATVNCLLNCPPPVAEGVCERFADWTDSGSAVDPQYHPEIHGYVWRGDWVFLDAMIRRGCEDCDGNAAMFPEG